MHFTNYQIKDSERFLRKLMACVCLKYGKLTLDTKFYRIPKEPVILTHENEHGETVVELQSIEPIDPRKHKKWIKQQNNRTP